MTKDVYFKATGEPHEWRVVNPNRTCSRLDGLLDRHENDPRALLGVLPPLVDEYPGDLELLHSLATAQYHIGNRKGAAQTWGRAWALVRGALAQILAMEPDAQVHYRCLDNRSFYRVLHGVVISAADTDDLEAACTLSRMAWQLSRQSDGLGFRLLHAEYLQRAGKWQKVLSFCERMKAGGDLTIEMAFGRAAAAAMLGLPRARDLFLEAIHENAFAAEILMHGVVLPEFANMDCTAGGWSEVADYLISTQALWREPQVAQLLKSLTPEIHEAQLAWIQMVTKAQRENGIPAAHTRRYLEAHVTPALPGVTTLLRRLPTEGIGRS